MAIEPIHDPHRLTPAELGGWRGMLRVHAALMKELDAELQAHHGLPLASYEVLLQLANRGCGSMRMSELAESCLLSRSGMTRMVDRLERDGLIERRAEATDARGARAVLTERGRALHRAAQATHLRGVRRRFTDHFSEEELQELAAQWERLLPGASGHGSEPREG